MTAIYRPHLSSDRKPLHELLPLDMPLSLSIDPSSACNFSCKFCFQNQTPKMFQPGLMTRELFYKIADDLREFQRPINVVRLFSFGESLLNKNLPEFVARIKSDKTAKKVLIYTNCSLLTREKIDRLLEAGLDEILLSIYGLDDSQYERFTGTNVDFNAIYENIQYLYQKRGTCSVHAKLCGTFFNEEDKKRFEQLFRECSDYIFIENAGNIWPGVQVDGIDENMTRYGQEPEIPDSGYKICIDPFYRMQIHSDGVVSACCSDFSSKLEVGNVNRESVKEIWNGRRMTEFRLMMLEGERGKKLKECGCCHSPEVNLSGSIDAWKEELTAKYREIYRAILGESR